MEVAASAPGKMVLTGEYAVLDGAPALVMAVDARARVELASAVDGYTVDAPDLGIIGARAQLTGTPECPRLQWSDIDTANTRRLELVRYVLEALAALHTPSPFHVRLDTSAFFSRAAGSKLGLGSSAALTVALAAAVRAHDGLSTIDLADLVIMHRRFQNNRGSGLDIAASLRGGVIAYRLQDGRPRVSAARWPDALHTCFVWSGRSASTGTFLEQLAQWRQREPARYGSLMRELGDCAEDAQMAVQAAAPEPVLEAVARYARTLAQLGAASGMDIVSGMHRRIAAIATDCGVVYKTCGAGGGDLGMALALDPDRMQSFHARLSAADIRTWPAQVDPRGVSVH